ncbi:unnamed protein product [Arctia plantaginis]|uniref:Uncharacterized protein n=1 Tax=Arctia plantaginis TaxID=874455 RepID=A0A8S0ZB94_ARCPL|nr:unnamed protein product [Arctia plantaginis]
MWTQLTEGHSKLYGESEPEKLNVSQYVKEKVYDLAEEIYIQYKIELETNIESFIAKEEKEKQIPKATGQNSKPFQIKLPKIVIPVFDGKYKEWRQV